MTDVAGSRALAHLKVEVSHYEDEADKEKYIHIKTETENYCWENSNAPSSITDFHVKINVEEVPFEIFVKDELDVGPTVVQSHFSSRSLHATEVLAGHSHGQQSSVAPSAKHRWRKPAKSSAERVREYRKRKREAAALNFAKNYSVKSHGEGYTDGDLNSYRVQSTEAEFRKKPKSGAERMREFRKRKKEAAASCTTATSCARNTDVHGDEIVMKTETDASQELEVNSTELRHQLLPDPFHAQAGADYSNGQQSPAASSAILRSRKSAKSSVERMREYRKRKREAIALNFAKNHSKKSFGMTKPSTERVQNFRARQRQKHEGERQHVRSSAAETESGRSESCMRPLEGNAEIFFENSHSFDDIRTSDQTDTLLTDRVLNVNGRFITEESSNADDPLRLNDMQDHNECFINNDSSVIEDPLPNIKISKLSTERIRKSNTNRGHSARDTKGSRTAVDRERECKRRPKEKRECSFEDNHSFSENTTDGSQTLAGRSECEEGSLLTPAPIPSRDMIVSGLTADGKKQLICGLCNTEFRFMSKITKHLRSHTGEKPFRCKVCDASFKLLHHLAQHERTHTGERPFHCELCDAKFRQLAHLIIHKRTHTGEKPYRCKICDAQFRQSGSLAYHEQKHVDKQKEYCCEMCNDRFKDAEDLSLHKRMHNGEILKCGVYRVKFKRTRPLVEHKRTIKVLRVVEF